MALPKYQTPSSYIGKKPPKPAPAPAWKSLQGQMNQVFNNPDPYAGEQAAIKYGWSQGLANDQASGGQYARWGGNERMPERTGRMVSPDYSGILGSFTADARARFGAGLADMEAQRLSQARSAINRLGVRDVPGMLQKLQKFGLTQADLQLAQDNPWSELKGIERNQRTDWNQTVANRAARGGFRSGGTIGARERIDQDAARAEAQYTQEALEGLGQGQWQKANWEREQRDAMEQAIANQQAQLAAAYQPYWQYD